MYKADSSVPQTDTQPRSVAGVIRQTLARRPAAFVTAVLMACILSAAAQMAQAAIAPTDSTEDIIYSADGGGSIETVGSTRTTTLRGNVQIRQGLIVIYGDTAQLEQDTVTGDLIRVTVEGTPARFTRNTDEAAETIDGASTRIIYYNQPDPGSATALSVVEFIGDARFTRGRTALQCSEIKHIVESGATDSPGPCSGILAPQDAQEPQEPQASQE